MFPGKISSRLPLIFLILLWAGVQLYFYVHSGLKVSVDTAMYTEDAASLLSASVPKGRSIWYLGYSAFLAFIFRTGGSLTLAVLFQVALSGIAATGIWQYVKKISGKSSTAFIATFLYLFWVKIHEWNVFVYTESLFTSFCVITFVLISFSDKLWQYLLLIPLIIFTFLIRPAGINFLISLVVFLLYILKRNSRFSGTYYVAAAILLLVPSFLLVNKMLESYTLIESYAKAEIIYPDISLGISVPSALYLPTEDKPPLIRLVLFMAGNPLYFLKISGIKFLLFFGNVKPYFSLLHNTFIVLVLYPVYYFAIKGFTLFPGKPGEKVFLFTFIAMHGLMVTLTTENWDGRFLVPVLPFVFIMASFGIEAAWPFSLFKTGKTKKAIYS